jgi:phosphoribosylglycinamide formyltransferase 1
MNPTVDFAAQCLRSPQLQPQSSTSQRPLRLGVLASGSGSNFGAIAEAIAAQRLNAQVQMLIYNNPDAKVIARTQQWGTPAQLLNHRLFETREALDHKIVEIFQDCDVELVVMAGWMRVVTPVLLQAFANRVINLHPSLLPSFKGIRAVEQALAAGVKITGCTVHWVVPEVDSGQIIMQAAVPVLEEDTPETLHARIQVQEHQIIVDAIAQIAAQLT